MFFELGGAGCAGDIHGNLLSQGKKGTLRGFYINFLLHKARGFGGGVGKTG